MRILLVEDDMELCRLMGFWLEEKGYLADICQDSQEAFYYLGMQAYNVVILDRMLPGMDGIQSLQRMRRKSCLPESGHWNGGRYGWSLTGSWPVGM